MIGGYKYSQLVKYTYNHNLDISKLVFDNESINRIIFQTDADVRWTGVYDAFLELN